ncbi:hypothetical protein Cgig2_024558 [Carnegiea gigantea]|uniref:Uncharacterized protein n=1 Tax=Carnegiea gigantea TaxID=171969 RepID=A0A9Q1GZP1_9CARY|nr:hypothetical protein Cgig2_024558 [Carnegiea gigantea]
MPQILGSLLHKARNFYNGLFNGKRSKKAPIVLGYIYRDLEQVASHLDHPEIFSALYYQRPESECPIDYPALMRYAGINGKSISFQANTFWEQSPKGQHLVDMKLLDKDFKFLLSIRSSHMEISWLTSKVEETFSAAEIITKTEELVDILRLHLLSSRDSMHNSKIAHMEDNIKELSSKALELELKKKKILKEERLCKMREDLMDHKQKPVTPEGELRASVNLKRKEKE